MEARRALGCRAERRLSDKPENWFKKDDTLAGRFDPQTEGTAEIYENAAGYYQRMVPVLDRFKKLTNLDSANLTIGEDVAQHDMVACASPGWQSKFDMPMDRIAYNCVSNRGFIVSQFVQSQPACVVMVSSSALAMFRSVFEPSMTMKEGGDIYQMLVETCRRPTYVTVDIGPMKLRSCIVVSPHFSYPDGFLPGKYLTDVAGEANLHIGEQTLIDVHRAGRAYVVSQLLVLDAAGSHADALHLLRVYRIPAPRFPV